jgi:hypothetical protein
MSSSPLRPGPLPNKGRKPSNQIGRSTDFGGLLHFLAAWTIFLYLALSPVTLTLVGWHYLGGGSEVENVHPATYLLVLLFPAMVIIDARFRMSVFQQLSNVPLQFFIVTCLAASLYATIEKGVSIAPFVDTFLSTILVAIIVIGMRRSALLHLRIIFDLGIAANVILMIIGYVTQQGSIFGVPTGQFVDSFGSIRLAGMLGLPLSAAQILCAYPLIVLTATPSQLTKIAIARMGLAVLVIFTSLLTGGRTPAGIMAALLLIFVLYSALLQIIRGEISKPGAIFFGIGVALLLIVIPTMLQFGFFDIVLARLEFDNGSALARQFALEILDNVSTSDLMFGIPAASALAMQNEYGLIAIEIAWINFILICGLVLTIPLFIGFCLFLFRYLPKYCGTTVLFFSIYTMVLTFSYNSIWSKTTVLAITVAISICYLRTDLAFSRATASNASRTRRRGRTLRVKTAHGNF